MNYLRTTKPGDDDIPPKINMSPTKMAISKGKTWKILIYKHHFLTGHTVRFRMINDDKCHVRFWRRKHQLRKLWENGRNDRWCWKAFLGCLKQTYSDISSRTDTSKISVGVVLSMKCCWWVCVCVCGVQTGVIHSEELCFFFRMHDRGLLLKQVIKPVWHFCSLKHPLPLKLQWVESKQFVSENEPFCPQQGKPNRLPLPLGFRSERVIRECIYWIRNASINFNHQHNSSATWWCL